MKLITYSKALHKGLTHYFTGTPCKYGHVAPRRTGDRRCVECLDIKMAKYLPGYRKSLRLKALTKVGGMNGVKCQCCGESTVEFLTFDHKDGNDRAHRASAGITGGTHLNYWVMRVPTNEAQRIFRILCWNCNCAIGAYGACPHQRVRVHEELPVPAAAPPATIPPTED